MFDSNRLSVKEIDEDSVLSKVQYYVDFHVWPESERMDPYRWLGNFTDRERPYALNILNVFLYFNNRMVNDMFRWAVHSLSAVLTKEASSRHEALDVWSSFLSDMTVTYVQGERPNPTDSGYIFARKARQVLDIDERQVVAPESAASALREDPTTPLVFVDDFVGSGRQMSMEWHREHRLFSGESTSFADVIQAESYVVYVPLVATELGLERIRRDCVGLRIHPVHIIDDRYSLTSSRSFLWPDELRPSAVDVLRSVSERAGIVSECGVGWQGFCELGLAMAFEHSVPDATMPLIYWEHNDWHPLVRRT